MINGFVVVACAAFVAWHVRSFLARHTAIQTRAALLAYRDFVRVQMLASLMYLASLALGLLGFFLNVFGGRAAPGEFALFNGALVLSIVIGRLHRNSMRSARELPAALELRDAYERLSAIWLEKAWPRFDPEPAAAPRSLAPNAACTAHGATAVTTCLRCGDYACEGCIGRGGLRDATCKSCLERMHALRRELARQEWLARALGVCMQSAALLALMVTAMTGSRGLGRLEGSAWWRPGAYVLFAAVWFGGILVMRLRPGTRLLLLVFSTLCIFIVPVGTGFALAALWIVLQRRVLEPEYLDVVRATGGFRAMPITASAGIAMAAIVGLGASLGLTIGVLSALLRVR